MKLLVVGATGTLGRQVAKRALDEGHQVRCLVRSPKKASFLKEWGAELIQGNLCDASSLPPALEDIDAVIDAATARATDSLSIKQVDWYGKVNLIQALQKSAVKRLIFFSILNSEKYPDVPLMEIKNCTEKYLAESSLDYTILRPCGFLQGLISQYAIPILDNQPIWITGESTPIAYMDTQDLAKFALRALDVPETIKQSYPLVGTQAWKAEEIIEVCENLSGQEAKISRVNLVLLRLMRKVSRFFQWTYNISDRLAFAEVLASGQPLNAEMDPVYQVFGLDRGDATTLESYLQEYFTRIQKKLKELDYQSQKTKKTKKKRSPFKSKT